MSDRYPRWDNQEACNARCKRLRQIDESAMADWLALAPNVPNLRPLGIGFDGFDKVDIRTPAGFGVAWKCLRTFWVYLGLRVPVFMYAAGNADEVWMGHPLSWAVAAAWPGSPPVRLHYDPRGKKTTIVCLGDDCETEAAALVSGLRCAAAERDRWPDRQPGYVEPDHGLPDAFYDSMKPRKSLVQM